MAETSRTENTITVGACWENAKRFSRHGKPLRIGPPYEDREYPLSRFFHHAKNRFWWSVSLWESIGHESGKESLVHAIEYALAIHVATIAFDCDDRQKHHQEIQFYRQHWPLPDREVSCFGRLAVSALEGADMFAAWTWSNACVGPAVPVPSWSSFLQDDDCEVWPQTDSRVLRWRDGLADIFFKTEKEGFASVSQLRAERSRIVCLMETEYLRYQRQASGQPKGKPASLNGSPIAEPERNYCPVLFNFTELATLFGDRGSSKNKARWVKDYVRKHDIHIEAAGQQVRVDLNTLHATQKEMIVKYVHAHHPGYVEALAALLGR